MTKNVSWDALLQVYLNTTWTEGETARVVICDARTAALFRLVEDSDKVASEANLAALCGPEDVVVGGTINARVGPPRLSLGILADDWDQFLLAPRTRTREPSSYFIKEGPAYSGMEIPTPKFEQYQLMLKVVATLEQAALFLDPQNQTLVFFKNKKIEVPIIFGADDLSALDTNLVDELGGALQGEVHLEQRLAILDSAVVDLVVSQSIERRFMYLVRNIGELTKRLNDGYRLFASSFSYNKIRGEVEGAQADFISKIHKTFVDIQGQLLGLPVATVVVATQLKAVDSWGAAAWGNVAVLAGAWLFAALLFGSCVNQWFTLSAIQADVDRQKSKLSSSFAEISDQFSGVFDSLSTRILWHRVTLCAVAVIAICGAVFATVAFYHLTNISSEAASTRDAKDAASIADMTIGNIESEAGSSTWGVEEQIRRSEATPQTKVELDTEKVDAPPPD